ncbi:TPA: helix-turn-helix domain-containing protein [Vibrio parahaemolyticus]
MNGLTKDELKGVKFGRKRSIDRKLLFALHKDGIGAIQISQRLKIARSTLQSFGLLRFDTTFGMFLNRFPFPSMHSADDCRCRPLHV